MDERSADIEVGPLGVWVHSRQCDEAQDHWDGNWLVVEARVRVSGAEVHATGPILHLGELAHFAKELRALHQTLAGVARLRCMEPNLAIALRAENLGGSADEGPDFFWSGGALGPRNVQVISNAAGTITVACHTASADYPNPNARVHGPRGARDLAVSRFDLAGAGLTYSAVLGGSQDELCHELRGDGADRIVIVSNTASTDFPFTANALPFGAGGNGGLVVHLDTVQDQILYATGVDGTDNDYVLSAYRESSGSYVLAGHSFSPNWPITAGAPQPQRLAAQNLAAAFLLRLQPGSTATTVQYSTWFGGSTAQIVTTIEPDGQGGVRVAGQTRSTDFPITGNAFDPTFAGNREGWIAVHRTLPATMARFGQATSPCGPPTFLQPNSAPIAPNPEFAVATHDAPVGALGALVLGTPLPAGTVVFNVEAFVTPPGVPGERMGRARSLSR